MGSVLYADMLINILACAESYLHNTGNTTPVAIAAPYALPLKALTVHGQQVLPTRCIGDCFSDTHVPLNVLNRSGWHHVQNESRSSFARTSIGWIATSVGAHMRIQVDT